MTLAETAARFPIERYLTVGNPRRSSWTDGTERALAFFWEPPSGGARLVRTQAPYVVRVIQRYFGTDVDGVFGDVTRTAIENHARASGLNVPRNWTAGPDLLGYALSKALLGGGAVLFPARNDFPNTSLPALARSPNGRESSYIGLLDLLTGREAPLGTTPQPAPAPPAPPQAPPAPPQQPGAVMNYAPPQQPPQAPPQVPPAPPQQPGAVMNYAPPQQPPQAPQAPLPMNVNVNVNGTLFQFAPMAPQRDAAGAATVLVALSPFGAMVAGPSQPGVPCPKAYVDENGVCKLKGYGKIPGARMAIPNPHGIVVDFANPATYRNADKTAAVMTAGGLTSAAAVLGALLK